MDSSSPVGMPRVDYSFSLSLKLPNEGPTLCPQRYFYAEPAPNCFYSTAAGDEPFGRGD
jgi:hypothetical protein